jgi:hypothetical protein
MYSWRRLLLIWLLVGMLPVQPPAGAGWTCLPDVQAHLSQDCCQHDQDRGDQPQPLHCPSCLPGMAVGYADPPSLAGQYRTLFLAPSSTLPVQPYFELLRPPRG